MMVMVILPKMWSEVIQKKSKRLNKLLIKNDKTGLFIDRFSIIIIQSQLIAPGILSHQDIPSIHILKLTNSKPKQKHWCKNIASPKGKFMQLCWDISFYQLVRTPYSGFLGLNRATREIMIYQWHII